MLLQRLRAQRDKLRKKHKKQLQEARDRAKELGLPAPEEPKLGPQADAPKVDAPKPA